MNEFAKTFFESMGEFLHANHYAIMFFIFCFVVVTLAACIGVMASFPPNKGGTLPTITPQEEEKYRRRREKYERFKS